VRRHSGQWAGVPRKGKAEREVIKTILDTLKTPEYQDVYPMFRRTAAFSSQPWDSLCVVAGNRKYWDILSVKLLRFALFDKFIKEPVSNLFPVFIVIIGHKILNKIRQFKYFLHNHLKL